MDARKKILAIAFDFDGCLLHDDYIKVLLTLPDKRATPDLIILHNQHLLEQLATDIRRENYQKVICLIGSNRQDYETNRINGKECAYQALLRLAKQLQKMIPEISVEIDRYLLADSFANLSPGTSFNLAIQPIKSGKHAISYFDESKLALTAAHLHKLANEYAENEIHYRLIDDKQEILSDLLAFYKSNANSFLPAKTIFTAVHYAGQNSVELGSIQGFGIAIKNYHQLCRNLLHAAGEKYNQYNQRYGILCKYYHTPQTLHAFLLLYTQELLQHLVDDKLKNPALKKNDLRKKLKAFIKKLDGAVSGSKAEVGLCTYNVIINYLRTEDVAARETLIKQYENDAKQYVAKDAYLSKLVISVSKYLEKWTHNHLLLKSVGFVEKTSQGLMREGYRLFASTPLKNALSGSSAVEEINELSSSIQKIKFN